MSGDGPENDPHPPAPSPPRGRGGDEAARKAGEQDWTGRVLVGTCAWADHEEFYPPGLKATERLAYYARRFGLVEVNSSFHNLLSPAQYEGWAAQTPAGFVFDVKAYGAISRHRRDEPPTPEVFATFRASYRPLAEAGKFGAVLVQFPPWFEDEPANRDHLRRVAEGLAGERAVVEFRHVSWLAGDRAAETLALLSELGMGYVVVDAPQVGTGTVPLVPAVTGPALAYVRLHGRNARGWGRPGGDPRDRYDYLYSPEELGELMDLVRGLAARSEAIHVLFNNNRRNYNTVNAESFRRLLGQLEDRPAEADLGLQLPLFGARAPQSGG